MSIQMPLPEKITAVNRPVKARVLSVQFGGGYIQSAPNGSSNVYETFSIAWHNLSPTDRTTVTTAIKSSLGTDVFLWTPPGDVTQKKYIIPTNGDDTDLYSESITGGGYYTISMDLRQVP